MPFSSFSTYYQLWTNVWLRSSLGRSQHAQRAVFVESLWWFLHRTTSFGVEPRGEEVQALFQATVECVPGVSVLHCPANMVSSAM